MDTAKTDFEPGDVIADRYRVDRLLGRGGMGAVYHVTDVVSGQEYALKAMLPRFTHDRKVTQRFVREVNMVRRLNHPAIVRIHDARREGALLFYVMDYVHGRSVVAWLAKRGQLDIGSTVRVLALVADALEYAHQFTIHRDISPENVMVLKDGSVRLLDFGLAKFADNTGAMTMVGDSLGKLQYKAPEQHLDPTSVDARADLYSLGVMFYVMLAGKFPKKDRPLTVVRPDLPRECDAFVEKATARDREARFQTAREFRESLLALYEKCVAHERKQARQASRRSLFEILKGLLWRRR